LSKQLKENARNMNREERKRAISLIVHFLGDMHCPMHIVFPDGPLKGNFKVTYKGKETTYHSFWDSGIMKQDAPWSFGDLAFLVDTATPAEIVDICQGDIYDYGRSSAHDSWAIAIKYKENDTLPGRLASEMRPLLYSQLRNAGYRLAAILNDIFNNIR
ncbi:MAG: S1/P1 nuclease, partial [Bacteroidales bacterium]|nr:S1/P1 nuclease [Bacteroidales bacterium]